MRQLEWYAPKIHQKRAISRYPTLLLTSRYHSQGPKWCFLPSMHSYKIDESWVHITSNKESSRSRVSRTPLVEKDNLRSFKWISVRKEKVACQLGNLVFIRVEESTIARIGPPSRATCFMCNDEGKRGRATNQPWRNTTEHTRQTGSDLFSNYTPGFPSFLPEIS